jgi:3-oxoacyl-[acyl-carrier protein] reductase
LFTHGARLALTYSTNITAIESLMTELKTQDPSRALTSHRVDVGNPDDLANLYREIQSLHNQAGPDILVSNAGYGKRISDIVDIPIEEFETMVRINLFSSFVLCKLAVPYMVSQNWGRIIFMSSIAAIGGGINGCHYAASKAGLTGMMKNLAAKLAKDGVTVNDVSPAMIGDTGMVPSARAVEGTAGDIRNIPVGRLGTPQECATVVTMLCRTGYMTGQSLLLAGGLR